MNADELRAEARRLDGDQRAFEALLLGLSPQARCKILRLVQLLVLVKGDELTMRALRPVQDLDAQIALLESRTERLQRQPAIEVRALFGANVRLLRKSKGFSQEALAEACNLHRTYVGAIERGERNISIGSMERIAAALGVGLPDLLRVERFAAQAR